MQIVLKILASVLILIFVPVFFVAVFIFSLKSAAYDPDILKASLKQSGAYEKLLDGVIPSAIENFPNESGSILSSLDANEAKDILNSAINSDQLQGEVEKTVDEIANYFSFRSESINLTYNIAPYKSSLAKSLESALVKKLDQLPNCTTAQLQKLASDQEKFPECKPAGSNGKQTFDSLSIKKEISEGVTSLPNEIALTAAKISTKPKKANFFGSGESPLKGLVSAREDFNNLFSLLPIAAGAAGVLLLLITLLRIPHWRSMATWAGWALVIAAATTSIVGLVLRFLPLLLGEPLLGPLNLGPDGVKLISSVVRSIAESFTNQILLTALAAFVVGLLLIVLKTFFPRKGL